MKRRNDPAAWPLRLHYHVSNVTVGMLLMLYLFLLLMLRQGAIAGTLFALVMTGLLYIRPVNELLECKRQRMPTEILPEWAGVSGRVVDGASGPITRGSWRKARTFALAARGTTRTAAFRPGRCWMSGGKGTSTFW